LKLAGRQSEHQGNITRLETRASGSSCNHTPALRSSKLRIPRRLSMPSRGSSQYRKIYGLRMGPIRRPRTWASQNSLRHVERCAVVALPVPRAVHATKTERTVSLCRTGAVPERVEGPRKQLQPRNSQRGQEARSTNSCGIWYARKHPSARIDGTD
jgi:hypothetical protein